MALSTRSRVAASQRAPCRRTLHLVPRATPQSVPHVAAHPNPKVQSLLDKCQKLGRCRFIVIGDGAILESVADWRQAAYVDLPEPKGTLATISNDDKSFECHIYLNKVAAAKFARNKARTGNHDVFALRLLDKADKVLITCLLHKPKDGDYDPAAVQAWEALRSEYGETAALV